MRYLDWQNGRVAEEYRFAVSRMVEVDRVTAQETVVNLISINNGDKDVSMIASLFDEERSIYTYQGTSEVAKIKGCGLLVAFRLSTANEYGFVEIIHSIGGFTDGAQQMTNFLTESQRRYDEVYKS